MKGKNGPTTFLPLSPKLGGPINDNKPSIGQYLTREQANFVYTKTESGEMINTETLQQELEHERQLNKIDDMSGDTNPYKEMIVNNAEKIEPLLAQMEQGAILSIALNYIQYDKHPKNFHDSDISAVNVYKNGSDAKKDKGMVEIDFGPTWNVLKEEYLDVYEGIQSEIVSTTRFNENSDLSTTYLGKSDRSKNGKLKAEESFPISEQGYTLGKLLEGTKCQLLLDTDASKSFMSKSFYMCCKSPHFLPEIASKTQRIQVGNAQYINVLFVIPVIIKVHGHRFEIYTLISEIHENIDLVLGIKNISELEGVTNSWDCCFKFLNRPLPIFPKERVVLKPKE